MQELFEKLAKENGKKVSELRKLWLDAKKQATKKHLRLGSRAHTQHALQVLKLLAKQPNTKEPEAKAKKVK